MNINSKYICYPLLVSLTLLISGCKMEFSVPADESPRLITYAADRSKVERVMDPSAPMLETINHWLLANSDCWQYAFQTRQRQIYIEGKNFYLNVTPAEVSVKYCRGIFNCHFWVKKDKSLFLALSHLITRLPVEPPLHDSIIATSMPMASWPEQR